MGDKKFENNNPLISNIYCADPTAVEYEGRLYVYGTNDHQQYEAVGDLDADNTYEKINSLVMLSTEDMVNWTYHGLIDTKAVSPWIFASWAPSICARVEDDGATHFYLYYSNSGWGVGMMTATSPVGPWSDPLGHDVVNGNTEGLGACRAPFDPGVVIDDNGVGWLSFGGGDPVEGATQFAPGNARIVRLGADMATLDSDIVPIPAPYHYEANEMNYINNTYVYTYNTSWVERTEPVGDGVRQPSRCSMVSMTTADPLNPDAWTYGIDYFPNPGDMGMEDSNNHTHLHKYAGNYYLFYHSLFPIRNSGHKGGFRSLCVAQLEVDESKPEIKPGTGSVEGVRQIRCYDPYVCSNATTQALCEDIAYVPTKNCGEMAVKATKAGGYVAVKGVDFGDGAAAVAMTLSGSGKVKVYLDSKEGELVAELQACGEEQKSLAQIVPAVAGVHDLFFVMDGCEVIFRDWKFEK